MINKPETVKDKLNEVLNSFYNGHGQKRIAEYGDELSSEAVEKYIDLHNLLDKSYEYIKSSSPTEIFKPYNLKIESMKDVEDYFDSSIDKHQETLKIKTEIHDIEEWFSDYFGSENKFIDHWVFDVIHEIECGIPNNYAEKFKQLPLEYVYESFNLYHKEKLYLSDPLTDFFGHFNDYFYGREFAVSFDWEGISTWYKTNILKLVGPFETYHANGQLQYKETFKNGKLIE